MVLLWSSRRPNATRGDPVLCVCVCAFRDARHRRSAAGHARMRLAQPPCQQGGTAHHSRRHGVQCQPRLPNSRETDTRSRHPHAEHTQNMGSVQTAAPRFYSASYASSTLSASSDFFPDVRSPMERHRAFRSAKFMAFSCASVFLGPPVRCRLLAASEASSAADLPKSRRAMRGAPHAHPTRAEYSNAAHRLGARAADEDAAPPPWLLLPAPAAAAADAAAAAAFFLFCSSAFANTESSSTRSSCPAAHPAPAP